MFFVDIFSDWIIVLPKAPKYLWRKYLNTKQIPLQIKNNSPGCIWKTRASHNTHYHHQLGGGWSTFDHQGHAVLVAHDSDLRARKLSNMNIYIYIFVYMWNWVCLMLCLIQRCPNTFQTCLGQIAMETHANNVHKTYWHPAAIPAPRFVCDTA